MDPIAIDAQAELDRAHQREAAERRRAEHLERQLAAQTVNLARQAEYLTRFHNALRRIAYDMQSDEGALHAIRTMLNELPTSVVNWITFEAELQAAHPEFAIRLLEKHPALTKMEVRVASLLRMGLSTADMAAVLCLSERSVEGHRLRLRRKMGVGRGEAAVRVLFAI